METDDDARDKDVPAEKDRIGLTEVRPDSVLADPELRTYSASKF